MRRVCFLRKVKTEFVADYRERHDLVWPEMLEALSASGWRNYSLFLRLDGLLIGCPETEDFDAALAAMAETDVNARWQADVAHYFEGLDDGAAERAGRAERPPSTPQNPPARVRTAAAT